MSRTSDLMRWSTAFCILFLGSNLLFAQRLSAKNSDAAQFGPVVRAYLGYLRNEQEVVDDRISRREISPAYYRRNSERIRALRQIAIHLVTQSGNDYVPELEAVTMDEFRTLFEQPPKPINLHNNQVLNNKFRYLGAIRTGDVFYVFARLDPYEQAALMEQQSKILSPKTTDLNAPTATGQPVGQSSTRPRRSVPR